MCFIYVSFSPFMGRFFDHLALLMLLEFSSPWCHLFLQKTSLLPLHQLYPFPFDLVPPPIFDYQPKHIFFLDRSLFAQALTIAPHLSSNGVFGMVYEHLLGCFILKDPSLGFSELFQIVAIVAHGDIFRLVALMLGANKLFVMAKDFGGFRPIVVGKMFLQLINCFIFLQLQGPF